MFNSWKYANSSGEILWVKWIEDFVRHVDLVSLIG